MNITYIISKKQPPLISVVKVLFWLCSRTEQNITFVLVLFCSGQKNWFQNKSYEFMGTPSKSQISSGYTVEISNFRLRRFLNPENSDHARGTRIRKEEFMVNF